MYTFQLVFGTFSFAPADDFENCDDPSRNAIPRFAILRRIGKEIFARNWKTRVELLNLLEEDGSVYMYLEY